MGARGHTVDGETRTGPEYASFQTSSDIRFEGTVVDITVKIFRGDITKEKVDVVVNTANKALEHRGGISRAICKAGGKTIQKESQEYVKKHGTHGIPVDVCAEQLMLATVNFAQSPPQNNTLRDIRFVNIDDQLNAVFVRTFSGGLSSNPTDAQPSESTDDSDCPICMDKAAQPRMLDCCGNEFCSDCIDQAFEIKPVCPICGHQYGALKGTQPIGGTMEVMESSQSLPGHPDCGRIQIHYSVPSGTQEECHPNPGKPYRGTERDAFLPDNTGGREVLRLLKKAFDNRLVFTVGTSVTTGETDVVTWNDIHHKTSPYGGASNYGYPDPGYLQRVTEELAAKGIR
ncbi:PREDICTED: E3 ubiquitin-protein ligase DTX3L-like [Branchiostoma belcheri]|uniref:E3 ubiquitin-protein ligase n=1 Tax=Branchiostoma belcheri TaxID=7741 RepID=A0A6P4YQ38_BRABE|nr:PREDICTED: E3 ubiquitin-protein ligase DTX3L-like [Branchiostoma belcheri]